MTKKEIIKRISEDIGLPAWKTKDVIQRYLHADRARRTRKSKSGRETSEVSKSTALETLLVSVVENPDTWLATPTVQFDGRRPADLIGTEEEHKVIDLLHAVDQGLF